MKDYFTVKAANGLTVKVFSNHVAYILELRGGEAGIFMVNGKEISTSENYNDVLKKMGIV